MKVNQIYTVDYVPTAFHCNHVSTVSFLRHSASFPWNQGYGSLKVVENCNLHHSIRQIVYNFLLVCHCKYSSVLYHFRVTWRWKMSWLWWVSQGHWKWQHSMVTVAISCIISEIKWYFGWKTAIFYTSFYITTPWWKNGCDYFRAILSQLSQPLSVSTQTGIKRRSKILELELLQEQSILTIKQ